MSFAHLFCKIFIFVAFTLVCAKFMLYKMSYVWEHYLMCCVLKCSSLTLYVAFLTAILYGYAFNHVVLHLSYVLLASKIDANANLKVYRH